MITLKISFLLVIDLRDEVKKNMKFKPHTKSRTEPKKYVKVPLLPEDAAYSAIEVQNPLRYIHIDYELFPKKFKYGIDIVCWGPVAKIFTKNGIKCVRTLIKEDFVWIPVFIEHYLNPLPTSEVRNLLKQIITFNFKMGKETVGQKAKSDKTSVFYIFNEDDRNVSFPEVFSEKPRDGSDAPLRKEVERILMKIQDFPIDREITTSIYNIDDVHSHTFSNIFKKRSLGQEIFCKEFYEDDSKKGKKRRNSVTSRTSSTKSGSVSSKKKKKKLKKTNSQKDNPTRVKIPAQVFFSDSLLATYQLRETCARLKEAYILLSSNNMLTSTQKQELCPLVVKLRKVNNLPDDTLIPNGFEKLFLHCVIPGITELNTSMRPITNTVIFDESYFIITGEVPKIKTLEILETKRVLVEIIGVKELQTQIEDKKKEKRKKKGKSTVSIKSSRSSRSSKTSQGSRSSKIKKVSIQQENVTLAATSFDLSPLAQNFFMFREKSNCYNYSIDLEQPPQLHDEYFIDRITMNELNLIQQKKKDKSPLTNNLLFVRGTTVKFEAYFLQPTYPSFYIDNTITTFRRLLVIFFKRDVAESFLSSILIHNRDFVESGPLLIPHFSRADDSSSLEDDVGKTLSGFVIDDGSCFIMYAEGPSNEHILSLIHQINRIDLSTGKVFHNSDYVFSERIYTTFYKFSGYFLITLKIPLKEIFSQVRTYVTGNLPIPCFNAIKKLNLILNSSTLKSILNQDLLPTEIELLSFDVEYGFNLKYMTQGTSRVSGEFKNPL